MPNIHQALLISATAEAVYQAIVTQERLSEWWTPGTTAQSIVGSIAHFPFGNSYFKEMKIIELVPSKQVVWNCIAGDQEWIGTTISFTIFEENNTELENAHPELTGQIGQQRDNRSTLLIFHHNNWEDYTQSFAECSYTWGQFLRSLKLLCETGKGKPWPSQHSIAN